MAWVVIGYPPRARWQNGKGSSANVERAFADKPSAERYAQHIVESGPYARAQVEERTDSDAGR